MLIWFCYVASRLREQQRILDREREDAIAEGEALKRLAAEYAEEERKKQEWRHQMGHQQAIDNRRQIEDTVMMRQIDKMQEEVSDIDYLLS